MFTQKTLANDNVIALMQIGYNQYFFFDTNKCECIDISGRVHLEWMVVDNSGE